MSVEKNVMENGLTVYGKRKVVTRTISIRRDQKELLKNISLSQLLASWVKMPYVATRISASTRS